MVVDGQCYGKTFEPRSNERLADVQGVASLLAYDEFHIVVGVVVGADESVSNEREYAVSLSFLSFSSIFSLSFCIPVMNFAVNCAVDPSEIEIGQEDTTPKAELHILYIFRQVCKIRTHIW